MRTATAPPGPTPHREVAPTHATTGHAQHDHQQRIHRSGEEHVIGRDDAGQVRPQHAGQPAAAAGEQVRVATPAAAVQAGADYLVVGRPITAAADPALAADAIVAEMEKALAANSSQA